MTFLDTSFLIHAMVPGDEAGKRLRAWLADGETLGMSAVAWGEFLCGPIASTVLLDCRGLLDIITPLDETVGELAAELFNATGRRRSSFADCMIAATAIHHEGSLATTNRQDFVRFGEAGLLLAD